MSAKNRPFAFLRFDSSTFCSIQFPKMLIATSLLSHSASAAVVISQLVLAMPAANETTTDPLTITTSTTPTEAVETITMTPILDASGNSSSIVRICLMSARIR